MQKIKYGVIIKLLLISHNITKFSFGKKTYLLEQHLVKQD